MKILHIVPSYKPAYSYGGPIESVARLCEALVSSGTEVAVFTTTANGRTELSIKPNTTVVVDKVPVTYFRRLTKDPTHVSPALWWRLYRQCRQYDIVHIHSWWNVLVIIAAAVCHLRGVRVVISPRGMLSDYIINTTHARAKRWIHRLIGREALRKSVFHATADAEYTECRRIIANWPGFTLPNILQLPDGPLARPGNAVFTLIYLSRIHPKKGIELLFEAICQLTIPVRLRIAGSGDDAYIQTLKNKAASLHIEDRVEWIGWQSRENKFRQLAGADLFVLPSFNENFANSVVEALSVGTPVVLTPQVGLAGYVQKNRLGWISEPNPEALASAIHQASLDDDGRADIGRRGNAVILDTFSADALARNYVASYQKLIGPVAETIREPVPA